MLQDFLKLLLHELRFVADDSIEQSANISRIIESLNEENKNEEK